MRSARLTSSGAVQLLFNTGSALVGRERPVLVEVGVDRGDPGRVARSGRDLPSRSSLVQVSLISRSTGAMSGRASSASATAAAPSSRKS